MELPPLPTQPRHRHRRRRHLSATIITLVVAMVYAATHTERLKPLVNSFQTAQPGLYLVTEVVDGDTIKVASAGQTETVRFIGMDTPETHDPRKTVQCFGQAAYAKTQELVGGKSVKLEADPADSDRDKYHRLLRYVYLPDGTFVNGELVRLGYGFAYTVFPNSKLEQFRAWEQEARDNHRGLWAGCNIDESSQIKQTVGPKS